MAASIALSACGGHGIVPSQSGMMPNSFQELAKKNPCLSPKVQPAWIFKGSCLVTKLPSKGASFKLKPYMGITVTLDLPANNGKNTSFAVIDAVGGKANDIEKWAGKPFPQMKVKGSTSFIYVNDVNGFNGLKFTNPTQFLVLSGTSTKSLPGKACPLSVLAKTGWTTTPLQGKVKGKTITFTIPTSQLPVLFPNGLPKGSIYFNVSCSK
ncbi:MAG: hypothetical protein JO302_04110 [Candidatus Eremiobacteraeota bacterium]|nr:hypothetical protein [Candidatus Eremiobacteraeota bacterium]